MRSPAILPLFLLTGIAPASRSAGDFRFHSYPVSWLLFAAIGRLAAAFAMRSLQRPGEQFAAVEWP
jgi:hypothetical protein